MADRAAAEGDALDRSAVGTISTDTTQINTGQKIGTLRIGTDGCTVAEAADLIAAATGFPAR